MAARCVRTRWFAIVRRHAKVRGMLLAQISDTHLVAAGPRRTARLAALEMALAYIVALSPRPEVIVHTGDLTHNARPEQYALARALLAEIGVPLVAVPGNRDSRQLFLESVPLPVQRDPENAFVQYALDLGTIRILALDTLDEGRGLGGYCEARFAHLSRMLAEGDGRPTVVAMHHPPVALQSVPGGVQFKSAEIAHRLTIELARDPSVVAVLAGHVHRRMTAQIGRASLETMPSLAVDLRKGVYPRGHDDRPILLLHDITATRVTTRTVALDPISL